MQRVIVTVRRQGETGAHDLEVPADMEAERLLGLIVAALAWDSDQDGNLIQYQVTAQPLGHVLRQGESLSHAGIWEGSLLVFNPLNSAAQLGNGHLGQAKQAGSDSGPVTGWHPLGIDLPTTQDAGVDPAEKITASGYTWKKLDD